jgi:ABC-2 type transport system permease protein
MLWYKAWLETRSRFLISLCGMTGLSCLLVYYDNHDTTPYTQPSYYNHVLHGAHHRLIVMWLMAVVLLMMGGLLREKAVGAASFTLSLPVSRTRLAGVRVAMGLIQALTLAVLPWGAMFVTAMLSGKSHSVGQACFHVVLLAGGGIVFVGAALLVSSLVEGEYTAPVVSYGIVLLVSVEFGKGPLRPYNPLEFMMGSNFFDRHSGLLVGPIPWAYAGASAVLAGILMAASVVAIRRREF